MLFFSLNMWVGRSSEPSRPRSTERSLNGSVEMLPLAVTDGVDAGAGRQPSKSGIAANASMAMKCNWQQPACVLAVVTAAPPILISLEMSHLRIATAFFGSSGVFGSTMRLRGSASGEEPIAFGLLPPPTCRSIARFFSVSSIWRGPYSGWVWHYIRGLPPPTYDACFPQGFGGPKVPAPSRCECHRECPIECQCRIGNRRNGGAVAAVLRRVAEERVLLPEGSIAQAGGVTGCHCQGGWEPLSPASNSLWSHAQVRITRRPTQRVGRAGRQSAIGLLLSEIRGRSPAGSKDNRGMLFIMAGGAGRGGLFLACR